MPDDDFWIHASDPILQTNPDEEFAKLAKQCMVEIREAKKMSKTWTIFRIPLIMPGNPHYAVQPFMAYLAKRLSDLGFKWGAVDHQTIIVSWSANDSKAPEPNPVSILKTKPRRESDNRELLVVDPKDPLATLDATYQLMVRSQKFNHLMRSKRK